MRIIVVGVLAVIVLLMLFVSAYTNQVEECEGNGGNWEQTGEKVTTTTFITINNTITPAVSTRDEYGCMK